MPAENITGFRLSPQQKHLWLLQQAAPHLPQRARCVSVIDGNLDVALLKRALQQVAAQHEILRTSFLCLPEMNIPVQVIDDDPSFSVVEHDLSALPAEERESRIELLYEEMRDSNGDSTGGMKLRVSLLIASELKHILLFSLPTLCADQATLKNFVSAVVLQYSASLNGGGSAATPMQYLVASEWLNELLESEDAEAGRDYWRKKDVSTSLKLELPFASGSSTNSGYQTLESLIDRESSEQIKALARRYETTLPTLLLASWQTLLWRLTGQSSITIATAFDGRTDEELKETLGLLAKYLPVQIQFEKDLRFSEVLTRVQATVEEAYAWQECFSWTEVTRSHEKSSEPSFAPICFEFDDLTNRYTAPRVVFSIDRQEAFIDNFKIKLSCVAKEDRLATNLHFESSVFALDDIRRVSDRFHTLLASALRNPEKVISGLEILSRAEREQVLLGFNQTTVDFRVTENLHELIEQQAARSGAAVAVVFEGEQLTYAELDQRANQLAHYLRAHNVASADIVGVLMERSVEMVVALLGVLKAGAAYLPLDPAYPPERLSFMLADADLRFVISHQAVEAMLPALAAESSSADSFIKVLSLDAEWATVAAQPVTAPGVHTAPDDLAYVLYTSGSTGQPKGVMISQRAICNHMHWMQEQFPLRSTDAVLQKTPFSFDASVWEFYAPLLAGARLVLARPGGHQEAQYLVEVMEREGVTRLQGVPTLLRMLVSEGGLERCTQLREVFSGGEVLRLELAESLLRARDELKLYNLYGPTEATIDATWQEAERARVFAGEEVGIGRPIANTQVYVLDAELQAAPVSVVGELYIGGEGLARGYLKRPALTAERFVPHPYSEEPGARLYRTGDMVRWLEGGELAYLGRVDAQVKLRGFRVELSEIEVVLREHPSVKECIVLVKADKAGDQQLVGYILNARAERQASGAELREYLRDRLPEYMVPTVFMIMDQWPLTPSGKVDVRALPLPEVKRDQLTWGYVAPETPVQQIVAGIWADLLKVEVVGAHDNFFELGGHSLLATQVISRMRETFKQEFSLRSLFGKPTVAEWAAIIEIAQREGQGLEAPPIVRVPRDGNLPLSFAQQRLWFLDQLEPGSTFYNIPSAIELTGVLNIDALERALTEIVRRHEVLRTTFAQVNGVPQQIIAPAAPFRPPVIDLSPMSDEERQPEMKRLIREEAESPFDLMRGPLLRVTLLRISAEKHIALLTMHHIVSDGWSTGILIREVGALYTAYRAGRHSPLEELPIQYADFAHWQRQWLQEDALEPLLSYWRRQLDGAPTVLELPAAKPRPAVQTFRAAHQKVELSRQVTDGLKALGRQTGVTLFMSLLAAFDVLLYRYGGQTDLPIGTPIANRNRLETEALIGFFINTLVLRVDLSGDPTFIEVLQRVRDVSLEAYAHQEMPFEKLVEELQPDRSQAHSPLFQVMFVLHNIEMEALELPGLSLSFSQEENKTSRFDLLLTLWETNDGIDGFLNYNTDIFDASTIAKMSEHFQTLIRNLLADPQQRLSDSSFLTEDETMGLTSADFPESGLSQKDFESLILQLNSPSSLK